jgi:outer membrane protein OmpA-like peptidoglycan-associated protein
MKLIRKIFSNPFFAIVLSACAVLSAQEPNPTATQQQHEPQAMQPANATEPLYKVTVVGRDIPAINYFHRQGATRIGFQGTSLLPDARGEAKVQARAGRTVIDASFDHLTPANGFGPEYLTYVLWAITPEGRPVNLGEVLPTGSKDKNQITVTTDLQAFGLIVTAEPYYAVTMPSDVVVVQNVVLNDKTQGVIEPVNAHYSLLPRGAYEETAGRHSVLHPVTRNERSPLELYEAVNAVQIAEAGGADKYAPDSMKSAKTALQNASDLDQHAKDRKQTITYAREAVQAAEDARIITIRKIKEEDEAAALQAKRDAEQAAEQAKLAAEQEAAERAKADAERERAEAEAAKAREAQQAAEQGAQQAAQQEQQMREKLREQLNAVLQTRETARGLIMNMSDVLFDFNKYSLKSEAREKLAKVSGILLAYPNLKLQVEGYTDNIGSDEYNMKLSQERADTVRDYLVQENVAQTNITSQGYGKSNPIADNSNNAGRAQNRRVQLVVSGAAIGIEEQQPGQPGGQANDEAPNQGNRTADGMSRTGTANPQP